MTIVIAAAIEEGSWGDLAVDFGAAREADTSRFFQVADFRRKCGGGCFDRSAGGIFCGGVFDFRNESRADYRCVSQPAQDRHVARERDAEAYGNGELRERACAANKRREIVGKRVFGSSDAGAGNEIEEAGRDRRDFLQAVVIRRRCCQKNRIEMMRRESAAVVAGLFRCEIGDKDAIGSGRGGRSCEFFEPHLQNMIVVAKKDERDFRRRAFGAANLTDEVEYAAQGRAGFEGTFRGPLDGGTVSQRIAERHAEFYDVGACCGQCLNEFERGSERRISGRNVGDDAHFAGVAQLREAAGNTRGDGGKGGHMRIE